MKLNKKTRNFLVKIEKNKKMNWLFKKSKKIPPECTGGDCYEASGKYILDHGLYNQNLTLVHGMVTGQGKIQGIRYDHAWIEDRDMVIDVSQGRNINLPKILYYALGNINESENKTYNVDEVREKILTNKHWGPWE